MAIGRDDVEILKPRPDKRGYQRIVLKNFLQVLLISDPETDKCAASMDVRVGSFSNPDGPEGLAHFLDSENTNYHFGVNADGFEEALDRFAQFFIKPLMSADATTREIKAVDSENQKNLLSDASRMSKHLSIEGHPYHKFSTGNWDTLEVRPKARGVDTRLELLKFYEQNYSANLMHLVVYAKESLDKIQSLVEDKSEEIRNSDRSFPRFPGQPCTSEHLQILVRTVPIEEGNKLRIVWPITPGIRYFKEGPCRYLGHLIGHEGEGKKQK